MHVLICGGGVIGAATAFHLARRGARVTVIERTGVACAASGKSGGFLARDWCDGTPLEALARRSFDLHAGLARDLGQDWGYRRLTTYAGSVGRGGHGLPWLSDGIAIDHRLGGPETTAQVDPARFTRALMREAEAGGAVLRSGTVEGVERDASGRACGVQVNGVVLPGDAILVAMGPWSILAAQWLPLPAVHGLKGHSLVLETEDVPAEALFLDCAHAGTTYSPEVFPRSDGTTYVCAVSSSAPLPADPADVAPDPGAGKTLAEICGRVSPALAHSPARAAQACYRPVTEDGLPLIGRIPGVEAAYVATGHSVWGILNAPATGEAVAELLLDGAPAHIDLRPFDPARLPALDPGRLGRDAARPG